MGNSWNKKFWELIDYVPSIKHTPRRKRRVHQFLYCCSCIRCHGNVFTEPLPDNGMDVCIRTHTLMGRIYEVHRWDGLRCHDIRTKFHKDWFSHSKVDRVWDTKAHRQRGDLVSLFLFFQNKESRRTWSSGKN
jgi:hypothetical protein